jgi:2-dehydro-3-deoxyphosphogluconate aldolase/(4S)-4-hydroxy-2-oxoglutarate aldolase
MPSSPAVELFRRAPVVPVVVLDDAGLAEELAATLVAAGLPLIEVTLRTDASLAALERMARVEGALAGAGTVLDARQAEAAAAAGARFLVSPGATPRLLDALARSGLPCLPGVATAGEAMAAAEAGFDALKFFPAESAGGVATLKALAGPLPHLAFCPTGGVDVGRAATYLGLPNVLCVGGTWVTPPDALAARDFARIAGLARAAAGLDGARPRRAA